MSERPTRELQTKTGATIILHDYITGRDKRAIEEVFLRNMEMRQTSTAADLKKNGSGSVELTGVKGPATIEAENKCLELVVKEIKTPDGTVLVETKAKVDFILDLPVDDYQKIVDAVNEITNPKNDEATS